MKRLRCRMLGKNNRSYENDKKIVIDLSNREISLIMEQFHQCFKKLGNYVIRRFSLLVLGSTQVAR
jgi:hypothetical protein